MLMDDVTDAWNFHANTSETETGRRWDEAIYESIWMRAVKLNVKLILT